MPNQREDTVEVDGDRSTPLSVGEFVDRRILRWPNAMIGNQNIEAPEALDRLVHQISGAVQAGKVAGDSYAVFRATRFDERLGSRLRALIVEKDFGASRHEGAHRGRANPTRAPGDQCNFAFKRKSKCHV